MAFLTTNIHIWLLGPCQILKELSLAPNCHPSPFPAPQRQIEAGLVVFPAILKLTGESLNYDSWLVTGSNGGAVGCWIWAAGPTMDSCNTCRMTYIISFIQYFCFHPYLKIRMRIVQFWRSQFWRVIMASGSSGSFVWRVMSSAANRQDAAIRGTLLVLGNTKNLEPYSYVT